MRFLQSIYDAILNRSPEELIGALLIAAAVAIVMSGLYVLGGKKWSPSPTLIGGLTFAAGASCMVVAAGYIECAETARDSAWAANRAAPASWPAGGTGRRTLPPTWSLSRVGWSSGFHVLAAADENRDGRLTPEEAAGLVRKADTDGEGSVDSRDIDRLIASRFRPRFRPSGLAAVAPKEREGPPDNDRGAGSSDDEKPSRNLDE